MRKWEPETLDSSFKKVNSPLKHKTYGALFEQENNILLSINKSPPVMGVGVRMGVLLRLSDHEKSDVKRTQEDNGTKLSVSIDFLPLTVVMTTWSTGSPGNESVSSSMTLHIMPLKVKGELLGPESLYHRSLR